MILINSHIASYKQASYSNHNPTDERKLLLNKREINKLIGKMQRDGLTIVPTKMYFKKGKAKIELAVAKGKKHCMTKEQVKKIGIGIVTNQDILENQANRIYLGIGSNLGNRRYKIEQAKYELSLRNIRLVKSSNFYESLSWPDESKPKYLNIVLEVISDLKPLELLKVSKDIEISLGRKKRYKNAPRECDIDIIDYKSKKISQKINLPHPRMHNRNFVLFPLFELNKNWKHPISKDHIKKLIISLPNRDIRSIKQI